MNKTKYGLQNKKTLELATVEILTNHDYKNSYTIGDYPDDLTWTTSTKEEAEFVRTNSVNWYNSSIDHPQHSEHFKPEDYQVVEIITTFKLIPVSTMNYEELTNKKLNEASSEFDKKRLTEILADYTKDKAKLSLKELTEKYPLFFHDIKPFIK